MNGRRITRSIGVFLAGAVALVVVYLAVSAYLGYRVGRAIHENKAHFIIRTTAGRTIVERFAVRYAIGSRGVPPFFVQSPTFWLALRRSE